MASFRVRQPSEYFRILWRRRYFVLVPFLLVTATLCYAFYKLPNIYESTTLIIVDPPKVDPSIGSTTVNVDLNSRINTLRQQVTSRSSLEQLITKYDLYKNMRSQKIPTEVVVDKMRNHIDVAIRNLGSGYNAFTISFQDQDRDVVQAITADLASQFTNENITRNGINADITVQQLDNELKRVKKQLDDIIAQRTQYIIAHPPVMKDQSQSIVGEMGSLSQQILAQQTQIGNLQNTIVTYQQMLAMAKNNDAGDTGTPTNEVTAAEGPLRVKRAEIESELKNLLSIYTAKHPDVKAAQSRLESIDKELKDLEKKIEDKKNQQIAARQKVSSTGPIQLQIDAAKRDLAGREAALAKMNAEYAQLQTQLRSIPALSAEMEKIERDYDTLRRQHDEMLQRRERAIFGKKLNEDFAGEIFKVQDPANLPEAPVFPRRGLLYPLALILGILSGVVAAFAFEARSLFTIRDAKDVEHYTRLPLLVTVPEIVTEHEEQRRRVLNMITAVAVVVLLVIAVPVLVKAIQMTKVLDVFIGGGGY